MDYVLGGVAALITGNVTPNRPKTVRKALTPTKHQPSPNVTPKSELVDDRSIFLSPTLQKKKAIVKKSPKRIFQNPDLDITEKEDSSLVSPKADKAKKHLKDDLDAGGINVPLNQKAIIDKPSLKKNKTDNVTENVQVSNENTPKKKKKALTATIDDGIEDILEKNQTESEISQDNNANKSPRKMKQRRKSLIGDIENDKNIFKISEPVNSKNNSEKTDNNIQHSIEDKEQSSNKKKNKKRKNKAKVQINITTSINTQECENVNDTDLQEEKENQDENVIQQYDQKPKKKNKKRSRKQKTTNNEAGYVDTEETKQHSEMQLHNIKDDLESMETDNTVKTLKKDKIKGRKSKNKKARVNPNAVTNKDSESEHDSDDEIESENEEINKKLLEKESTDSTSEEEEEEESKQPAKKVIEKPEKFVNDPNELRRTLFVGNVPFSNKTKKEIKKIFSKHGQIETVRIRTVPVKDARDTPKLAVIKNELHPDRSTVNVYVKFVEEESVEQALVENNTVLNNYHLRVSRSNSTGAEHDPRCSVFVGNMPFALEDEALRAKFEKCGEIDSVRIIRDKKTNAGKGFGYVNFKSKDGVELALQLPEEDLTIKNRIMRVQRCTQSTQKQGNRFNPRNNGAFGGNRGNYRQIGSFGRQPHNEGEGAYRRVMNKRQYQDGGGEGPPNKRQNMNQPRKEKKTRKEFVGMTSEKRKKPKFDKSQRKKKMLSEILTKGA